MPNPTIFDYAILAAAAYDDVRKDPNKVVFPTGWNPTSLLHVKIQKEIKWLY